MQILIMTGPHSKVREITLGVRHLVLGSALGLALTVGGNSLIDEFSNDTQHLLQAVNSDASPDQYRVSRSEEDYEAKLLELQARVIEAERNLAQLDDLRSQLAKTNGQVNVANNVIDLGNAQGGPMNPANAVINLGNQGEQYGARLDRTMQDTIALSARIEGMQKSLTTTWDSANAVPTGSPLALMPQASSGLGYRQDPITGERSWHEGTDFPAAYGTPILATAEGVVLRAGWDPEYGNVVDIQHKNSVITRYAHAQELLVKQGDFIKQSQVIAKVGSTGRSTGPHLHYEVLRDGIVLGKN
jgi:murein DD-endopeptidase MepM/ murein hydrolase activator NlpD